MFILIQCYEQRQRAKGRFEAHQRYTDLQSLSAGHEWIEVCDVQAQRGLPEFDDNGNIYFPLTAASSASAASVRIKSSLNTCRSSA